MKVVFVCLLSAFLVGLCNNLYAQHPSAIQGKVLMAPGSPAEASTIVLLKYRDSSIVNSNIIDKNGLFNFTGIAPGIYLLFINRIGFKKTYTGPYHISAGQTLVTANILLKPDTKQLKEVSIVSTRPDIEVRPGKIILNVQNSIMAAGSSAYDILRQSPGVRVDNNNGINIIGKQNALITIDGKPTNLSGDNLLSILRSMQSNSIDYIELITSGSAKYDAAAGGIVNIVLKKGKYTGLNATITGTAGYGKYGKNGAGIVFNDRTKKFNIFGNYNHSYNNTFHNYTIDRIIADNNVVSDYYTDYKSKQETYNNTFSIGTDFFISPNQTIGFLVNGTFTDNNIVKNNDLKISNQSVLDSIINANANLNRHYSRVNYNLNYNGKLDNSGKTLSADFNYTANSRASSEYITNDFYDPAGNTYRAPLLLQNLSPSNLHVWLSTVDFNDPISKTSKLEAGLKYSNVTINNNLIFGPLVNGQYQSDPRFTNHFLYTENVNAAYINFENKFNKFALTTSLRAEQTIAKGNSVTSQQVVNRNYLDLFPQVLLTYKYNDKNDFSFSYNRGITRPDYGSVNPFLYYTDLYDYGSGNPYLKPEYSNFIELAYNYNKKFVTTLYSHIISNAYEFKFFEQNDASKVNVNIPTNLGTIYNYGFKFFAPIVFTSWWNANFLLDASYQRYVSFPVYGSLNKGTQDIIFKSTQNLIISKTIFAIVSGSYETPTFYGISQFKATYWVDAGISKQLFNNRASLKLSANDIFNTVRDRYSINYQNLKLSSVDKVESQVVRLTFTYMLGKTSVKTASHHTGNEEEQKRIGSGAEN